MKKNNAILLSRIPWLIIEMGVRSALIFLGIILLALCIVALPSEINPLVPEYINLTERLDPNLLTALGTVLIAISALYVGNKIRKYQELEAEARASLALNVAIDAKTHEVAGKKVIELIVEVHNVSRKSWYVPMAYFFLSNTLSKNEIAIESHNRNLADYGITLCKLQPDERDMFFRQIVLNEETAAKNPIITVTVELVGASDKYLDQKKERMNFISFMNSDDGIRHGYLCISRCKDENSEFYGDRCFVNEKGEINQEATIEHYQLLQDMMIWTREKVIR